MSDGHEQGGGHAHHHAVSADADSRRLTIPLALIVGFMAVEVVVGILVHSLALLSDAAHMLTDAGALAMSLLVIRLVQRPAGGNLTFGLKRTEILSAQANDATLFVPRRGRDERERDRREAREASRRRADTRVSCLGGRQRLPVLSAHVLVEPDADCHAIRRELEQVLDDRFGIDHTTLQVDHRPDRDSLLQIGSG